MFYIACCYLQLVLKNLISFDEVFNLTNLAWSSYCISKQVNLSNLAVANIRK